MVSAIKNDNNGDSQVKKYKFCLGEGCYRLIPVEPKQRKYCADCQKRIKKEQDRQRQRFIRKKVIGIDDHYWPIRERSVIESDE